MTTMLACWRSALLLALGLLLPGVHSGTVINSTDCGNEMTTWTLWAEWSQLGQCSVMCDSETGEQFRQRTRTCPVSVMTCDAEQFEREFYQCQGTNPPVNGGIGHWSAWEDSGTCSTICGTGTVTQTRNRTCDNPPPSCGGMDCLEEETDRQSASCSRGRCGRACTRFAGPTVLSVRTQKGSYLLCLRGAIALLDCPGPFDIRAYFRYGYFNGIRLYRVCNYFY